MRLFAEMLAAWPVLFGMLVLILGGVTIIALGRALVRIVHMGPMGWFRDAFRVGQDMWLPFAVLVWMIVGALMITFLKF